MSKFILEDLESSDPAYHDLRIAVKAIENLTMPMRRKLFSILSTHYSEEYGEAGIRWDEKIWP